MKFESLFLAVLLILGTFVIPLNLNNSFGDGVLLFTIHKVAGSGDVHTENLIKERCFVHVQTDVYSAHHGPFHRNNPDKTFYPGDAFNYQVTTWKAGCGNFWQPCPIESTPNNTVPNGGPCIKGGAKGPDNDVGTGVIDSGYVAGAVSLSKQAFGEQRVCHKTEDGWDCNWETVTARATQSILMRLPNLTVDMWTIGEEFTEDDVTFLTFDEYMYPESFFHNTVNVTAVDSDGAQDNSVHISIEMISREEIEGTLPLNQYVHDKVIFDTDDDGFAQIITGLDTDGNDIVVVNGHDIYPLDNLTIEGNGKVSLEKTRRVLSSFTQYDTVIDQTFDPNEILDISGKYLLDTKDGILSIPLTTGLDALSPYTISITADNGSMESTNEFEHIWYDFSIDYNYQINMDDDNVLKIERDPGNMHVLKYFYDENFGALESLEINGVNFEGDDLPECFRIKSTGACYLLIPEDHQLAELHITGTNIWGGIAIETLPKITSEMLNPAVPDPIDSIFNLTMFDFVLISLVLLIVIYLIYRTIRWYFGTLRE